MEHRQQGGWRGWVGGEGFAPRGREADYYRRLEEEERRGPHDDWRHRLFGGWLGHDRSHTHREHGGNEFYDSPREWRDREWQERPRHHEEHGPGRHEHPGQSSGRFIYRDVVRREPDWRERYQDDSYFDEYAPRPRDGYGGQTGQMRQVGYGQFGATPRHEGSFAGRGPRGYRRGDERIREDVCDRLCEHPGIDASEVYVSIREGEVTLQGSVPDRWMKRMAEDVADGVAGVAQVHNHLRIAATEPPIAANAATRPANAPSRMRASTGA